MLTQEPLGVEMSHMFQEANLVSVPKAKRDIDGKG